MSAFGSTFCKSTRLGGKRKRVVIIGAGVGGIMTGIAFKQKLKFDNFTIYEQSDGIGGTWHHNTYPGCAADIPTFWYSLSTCVLPTWTKTHLTQPELLAYWEDLASQHDLYSHLKLRSKVTQVIWDETKQVYRVSVERERFEEDRGETFKFVDEADVVVSAVGALDVPKYPKELGEGLKKFKGAWFHSAKWDHGVSLKGKRVAVIGNGSSACQMIPVISEDPTVKLVNFCRTPNWFFPDVRMTIPASARWVLRRVPGALRLVRWLLFVVYEFLYVLLIKNGKSWMIKKLLGYYIRLHTPQKYHTKLIPTYDSGCKRLVIDAGYLKSLCRENVELNYDGIQEVTENGIVTKAGQVMEFDVIVVATGFVTDQYPIDLRGVGGKSMEKYYEENGGPTAYKGTTVPGFPNFFTLYGPNIATGHASVIFTEECQTHYILQLLKPLLDNHISTFCVTPQATKAWNAHLQSQLESPSSVWTSCRSWYRAEGGEGKNSSIWPGPVWTQWWHLRKPIWSDYNLVPGPVRGWEGDTPGDRVG